MLKYQRKVLDSTKLLNTWFIDDNILKFKYTIYIYNLEYEKIYLEIKGILEEPPYRIPKIEWINNKPLKYTYHAGGEYHNNLDAWFYSTMMENKVENLYLAYILAEKYDVKYLMGDPWDELFYTRSKYTINGSWAPYPPHKCDKILENIQNEILFFSELKNYIYLDNQFIKNNIHPYLTPIQDKFIYNKNIMVILELIEYISTNHNEFEESLFDLIFAYLPNENIYKNIWKLDIFRWKQTKQDMIDHFIEFNKLNF